MIAIKDCLSDLGVAPGSGFDGSEKIRRRKFRQSKNIQLESIESSFGSPGPTRQRGGQP
jgi:hypothetical protein